MKRRKFVRDAGFATAAILALPTIAALHQGPPDQKRMLMRYDAEWWGHPDKMKGFFEKLVEVHRRDHIPVTLFCKGETLKKMNGEFKAFYQEVKHDPFFDIQDHSFSHIGIGYANGKPVEVLESDYRKSFDLHEEIFGKRPFGISRCGTSDDGPSLTGFDATEKSRKEFEMLVKLGARMIDTFLTGIDGTRQFVNYDRLGQPGVMGFISGFSDTAWMDREEFGDPVEYILKEIRKSSLVNDHMPVMFHDWVAWQKAPDQELTHVRRIAESARKEGYAIATHLECYYNKPLWQGS